ncbi:MAG TPA: Calx-beta domain-containing protein [Microcoleaceae cyanobacterium]|jgi:predicted outer membrane repeat protein
MIITVNNTNDAGAGSLRDAIARAQSGDTIQFDSALANQTIRLTSGQIDIGLGKNLIIDGAGASNLTISGNNASRIFYLNSGIAAATNLTVKNLTLADGYTNERGGAISTTHRGVLTVENVTFRNNVADKGGGAIFSEYEGSLTVLGSRFDANVAVAGNDERGAGAIAFWGPGPLTVRDSDFTNNRGIVGGAINSLNGKLTIENSRFINNDTTAGYYADGQPNPFLRGYGGAIYTDRASASNEPAGTIRITNSVFEGNKGRGGGGAAHLYTGNQDNVIVEGSVFRNNSVQGIIDRNGNRVAGTEPGNGGALNQMSNGANQGFVLRNTSFVGNTAANQGGGLWVMDAPTTITNSTFSGNQAPDANVGYGGGLALYAPTTIVNSTIANNTAGWSAGGVLAAGSNPVTVQNTIFYGNTASNPYGIQFQTSRQLTDLGGNIQWPPKGTNLGNDFNATNNITLADPLLGTLQQVNNTYVYPLLAGSPAINAGVTAGAPTIDELGTTRDTQPDIGAFEFGGTLPPPPALGELQIGNVTIAEGSTGSQNATFTVNLSAASTEAVTVNYATADNTALAGSDYTSTAGVLTFAPGETSQTISVPIVGDTVVEPDEAFFVNLSNPTNATIKTAQGTGSITNDDIASTPPPVLPGLTIADATLVEGNSGTTNAVFTVSLSAASTEPITVSYATADSAATAGSDYTAVSDQLTFAPGETSQTISVPIVGDTVVEPDETFFINLSNPTNATIATAQGIGTITNDDLATTPSPLPGLSISNVSIVEGNSGTTNAVFTVSLSAASTEPITVGYATADSAATAGSDYTAVSDQLTFAPGETNGTIQVPIVGDGLIEPDETFFVNLTNPTNATITTAQGIGTITNDDLETTPPPSLGLSIADVTLMEGDRGTTNAVFTVSLSAPSDQLVTVDYATADSNALANSDYQPVNGTLNFNPGETSQTLSIPVLGDRRTEIDEAFRVNLTNPTNAALTNDHAIGTIQNDDVAMLRIRNVSIKEGNSGTKNAVFKVSLTGPVSQPVTVDYMTENGSAISGQDYTAMNGQLTFSPGQTEQTLTVAITGDTVFEPKEVFYVKLSNATNATIRDASATGIIRNDDRLQVDLPQINGASGRWFTNSLFNSGATVVNSTLADSPQSSSAMDLSQRPVPRF